MATDISTRNRIVYDIESRASKDTGFIVKMKSNVHAKMELRKRNVHISQHPDIDFAIRCKVK